MVDYHKVFDKDHPNEPLTRESKQVMEFFALEECKYTLIDQEMLSYFRAQFKTLSSGDLGGWTIYLNKEQQKVYYKQEEGDNLITCFSEVIINAPFLKPLAMLAEVENTKYLFPDIT
mmetsp:Transcript_24299/g.23908  ORF Transcript_24299/g.23908 Transcript_24299/m.23908 type:complete len:117 (+) Transcript_24299:135-485(+)